MVSRESNGRHSAGLIYIHAFTIGFVVMAFEMIGSRFLNPYFGSSIYTWASIISTVLIALSVGYFAGGRLADKMPTPAVLGWLIVAASGWFAIVPFIIDPLFAAIFTVIRDVRYGSLVSSFLLLFLPLMLLGVYSPFAIRLLLGETGQSGTISGRVYGISTLGSILGTLVTTFYFIPIFGIRAITYFLAAFSCFVGLSFVTSGARKLPAGARHGLRVAVAAIGLSLLVALYLMSAQSTVGISNLGTEKFLTGVEANPQGEFSPETIKAKADGILENIQTEYNDIFVTKQGSLVTMSFQRRNRKYEESVIDLDDLNALPVPYTRTLTVALPYVPELRSLLMLGLGGGTTTRYLHRYLPQVEVLAVELDAGVIDMARRYFGIVPDKTYRVVQDDARVFLARNGERHNAILMDTFRGGYIPFHLLTREFFELVRERLTKDGVLVINLRGGNELFPATVKTLRTVFANIDLYSSRGAGNVIVVAYLGLARARHELIASAVALQARYRFAYPLPDLLKLRGRLDVPLATKVLTDDFAPVNSLKSIERHNLKRW